MKRSLKVIIGFVLASALAGCETTFYEAGTTPITLSPAVVAGFEKYKQADYPLFFAVSTNGRRYAYYWCDSIYCDPDSSGQAISLCERQSQSGGLDCKIFAFERSIVWKGPITKGPGTLTDTQLSSPDSNLQSNVARLKRDRACPKCNLKGVRLLAADLQGANLQKANLKGAHFDYTNLQGGDLRNANLIGARLYNTNLQDGNLKGSDLRNANLIGANLKGADLSNANLRGARLDYADLRGANFTGANLREVNLSFAKIDSDVFAMAKRAGALTTPQTKTSLGEEKRRLSRSEVRSLLLGNTEVGVLRRPSRPAVEGYSGQTYRAYYQDNNTVWYKLDAADDIKRWDWGIRGTGVVCRGPEMGVQSWCRAITPDGAGGYKAIGFRTGNFRYQFRVEKGLFGLPEHLLKP